MRVPQRCQAQLIVAAAVLYGCAFNYKCHGRAVLIKISFSTYICSVLQELVNINCDNYLKQFKSENYDITVGHSTVVYTKQCNHIQHCDLT